MWLLTPNEIIKNKLKLGVYKSKLIIYNSKCEVVKNLRTSQKQIHKGRCSVSINNRKLYRI